jgi:hypothetical protein
MKRNSIASITASLIGWAVTLVITYLKTFKTAVIVLIGKVIIFLMTNGPIISSVRFSKLIIPSWDQFTLVLNWLQAENVEM